MQQTLADLNHLDLNHNQWVIGYFVIAGEFNWKQIHLSFS